ncbi:WD and tetratricopeptide repeats protein 1-like isoform X1 [Cimex lectularius]|uniref:WD and tetratricopeptide repeats protein 1 n=1 Tax=Cimex lectularius TaxID=79782 RepID=A0A8I6TM11_CIMLE|nr:WD and tetratricopeptide repeats protein 1-like isoform X1 [Cimex lectularius]
MPRVNSVTKLITQREYDSTLCRPLQKRLHVTSSLVARLGLEKELHGHTGCVNCLEWDSKGRKLASASDDFHVIIWDPFLYKCEQKFSTGHHGNIFSVKFMPDHHDDIIVTGAGDDEVRVHNLVCKETTRVCLCHGGRIKRLAIAPDSPDLFWSAAEDGIIRQFDLRVKHNCSKNEKNVLIDLNSYVGEHVEAKCLAINPLRSELIAVGASDPYIRIYDRRMISPIKEPSSNPNNSHPNEDNLPSGCVQYFVPGHVPCKRFFTAKEFSATYVTFGPNGKDLLVNLGNEHIYLFDINAKSRSLLLRNTNDNQELSDPLKGYCNGFTPAKGSLLFSRHKPQLPDHINALKLAGNALFEKELYTRSIRVYNEAIGEYPNSSVFYSNRAAAYMKRDWYGDTYAALRDCIVALSYDPNNVKAFFRLSRCLFELAWYAEAQASLNNFKQRFPNHAKTVACQALERDIATKLTKSGMFILKFSSLFCLQTKLVSEENSEKDSGEFDYAEISEKELEWRERANDYQLRFYGHCNTTTDIKEANFFGSDGQFIVAGSDDGSIFIWDRKTTNNIRILKGDSSIVNCLQPHPTYCLLATSGIEHVVRLWSPRPQDGHENDLEVKEKDEVALTNQRRMKADPFDVVLMSVGLVRPNEETEGGVTYNCRTS